MDGYQTALSTKEETLFVADIKMASNWGFRFTRHDIRLLVKEYLDRIGTKIFRKLSWRRGVLPLYSKAQKADGKNVSKYQTMQNKFIA